MRWKRVVRRRIKRVGRIEDWGKALLIAFGKRVLMRNHRGCSTLLCPSCRWKSVGGTVSISRKPLGTWAELNPTTINLPIQWVLSLGHAALSKGPETVQYCLRTIHCAKAGWTGDIQRIQNKCGHEKDLSRSRTPMKSLEIFPTLAQIFQLCWTHFQCENF